MLAGVAEPRGHARRQRADGDEHVDAALGGVRADLRVEARLVGPELEHVAEHRHAPGGCGRGEIVEGGAHRHRVGVVAVVDDEHPPGQLDALAAQRAQAHVQASRGLHADGARRGQRGQRVGPHVLRGERQLEPGGKLGDVAAGPERHRVQVVAPVGLEQRLTGGQHRGRARPQIGDQLRLGGGDRLQRAEQLEVDRPDVDDDADVGLGDRRQLGDLADAAHRHLEHEHLAAGRRGEDRQRQADLRVEVLLGRGDRATLGDHRREQVLRRGLAGRAGDRDDLGAERTAPRAREGLQPGERILAREQHARLLAHAAAGGVLRRHEHAPGAGGQRRGGEATAVDVLAAQADEEIAGADVARVDRHAGRAGRPVRGQRRGAREMDARGPRDALRRPVAHAVPPARRRRRRRAACGPARTPGPARGPCRR